jgi:hypothetical protein
MLTLNEPLLDENEHGYDEDMRCYVVDSYVRARDRGIWWYRDPDGTLWVSGDSGETWHKLEIRTCQH